MTVRAAATLFLAGALLVPAPPPPAFQWPTGGPVAVVGEFAPPSVPWGSGHRGVDLALAPGTEVLAAGNGTVVYSADLAGRGVVSIEHAGGLRTTYEPVTGSVRRGDAVVAGQVIGTLEAGHCPDGCLHLGARRGEDDYIDPLSLFERVRIRLKPIGGLGAG